MSNQPQDPQDASQENPTQLSGAQPYSSGPVEPAPVEQPFAPPPAPEPVFSAPPPAEPAFTPPPPTQNFAPPPPPPSQSYAPPPVPPAKKKGLSTGWIIAIVVVLLLCCCCVVGGVILYQNGDAIIEQLDFSQLYQLLVG